MTSREVGPAGSAAQLGMPVVRGPPTAVAPCGAALSGRPAGGRDRPATGRCAAVIGAAARALIGAAGLIGAAAVSGPESAGLGAGRGTARRCAAGATTGGRRRRGRGLQPGERLGHGDDGPTALAGGRRAAGRGGGVDVGAAAAAAGGQAAGRAGRRPAEQRVLTGGQQALAAAVGPAGPRHGHRAVGPRLRAWLAGAVR